MPRFAAAHHDNRAARRFVHRRYVPSDIFCCRRVVGLVRRFTGSNLSYRQNLLPWTGQDFIGEVKERYSSIAPEMRGWITDSMPRLSRNTWLKPACGSWRAAPFSAVETNSR